MKAKRIIEKFLDRLKKVQHRSNFQKLKSYLSCLYKLSYSTSEAELLTEAISKYVDVVTNLSANKGYREQINICKEWLDPLEGIVTNNDICEVYIEKFTRKMFDMLIAEDMSSWCVKKEILKMFLTSVNKSSKEVKQKVVQELSTIYLFKIVDSISTSSDYDFQVTLIETVFRMYGKGTILSKLPELIPESQELKDSFASISGDTFDEDVRRFLTILNRNSKKVFSVICNNVFMGCAKCGETMEGVNGLWVDFNLSEKAISWYTATTSLNDNNSTAWNYVLFFASDVELAKIYRPLNSNEAIVYVKLKESCLFSVDDNAKEMMDAGDIKLVVSCESSKVKTLLGQVLPGMFRHKLHNNAMKVSLAKKSVYKPLKVSVHKRSKSDSTKSKSDTSSFIVQMDPFCGTSSVNSPRNGSVIHSVSSSSTKYEVISISDGSVRSESSIDLVPKSDETQNSQYETAQMCNLDHLGDSCKVSSNQRGMEKVAPQQHDSEILSDDLFFDKDSPGTQDSIKIISGRCSGSKARFSQGSTATSTPKKTQSSKREESQETEKSTHVSNIIAEPNSLDCFETPMEFPQTEDLKSMSENKVAQWLSKPKCSKSWGKVSKMQRKNKIRQGITILEELPLENVNETVRDGNEMNLIPQRKQDKGKKGNNSKNKNKQKGNKENLDSDKIITVLDSQDMIPEHVPIDGKKPSKKTVEVKKLSSDVIVVDFESHEANLDVPSQEVLPATHKPTPRKDIIIDDGRGTKITAKEKLGDDAATIDANSVEDHLNVPTQEVVSAIIEPIGKKDKPICGTKNTEMVVESREKPSKRILTVVLRRENIPNDGKITETLAGAKKTPGNDIIIDRELSDEILDVPNQEVVRAVNKPTSKKDMLIDERKNTEQTQAESKDKPNKDVTSDNMTLSEEYPDVYSYLGLSATKKPTQRNNILNTEENLTMGRMFTQENLNVPVQEILPETNRSIPGEHIATVWEEIGKTDEKRNENVSADNIELAEEFPDELSLEDLPATDRPTVGKDILIKDTVTVVKAQEKMTKDTIIMNRESIDENLDVPSQEVLPTSKELASSVDILISDVFEIINNYKNFKDIVKANDKQNKEVTSGNKQFSDEFPNVLSQEVLPAANSPILRKDILTEDTETIVKPKEKSTRDIIAMEGELIEDDLNAPSQEVLLDTKNSTPREDVLISGEKNTKKKTADKNANKEVTANNIEFTEKFPDKLSQEVLPVTNKPRKDTIKKLTKALLKAKEKSIKDITATEGELNENGLNVSSQEVLPEIEKSTPSEDILMGAKKSTKRMLKANKKINKRVIANNIELAEEFPDELNQEVLPVTNRPRKDTIKKLTKTSLKANEKSTKDITAMEGELIEDGLNAPSQEVLPETEKSTPSEDILMGGKKSIKKILKANKKINKNVPVNNIELAEEFSDVQSKEDLLATNRPTPRKGTIKKHTKTPLKAKEKSTKDITAMEGELIEDGLNVPSQEVLKETEKSTPSENILMGGKKSTKRILKANKQINNKVPANNIELAEEFLDVQSKEVLSATKSPTLRKDTVLKDTKTIVKAKENNVTMDTDLIEENQKLPSQEILPETNKSTVIDDQRDTANNLLEEDMFTQVSGHANDVSKELDYEDQFNASTVENDPEENKHTSKCERDFDILKKLHDQTTTTLGSRRRRKIYNSGDLTYLANIVEREEVALKKNEADNMLDVEERPNEINVPLAYEQEMPATHLGKRARRNKQVKHNKVVKRKVEETKKLKVAHLKTNLHVDKYRDMSKLKSTFSKLLDSFKKTVNTSLSDIMQDITSKAKKKKNGKITKKTGRKNIVRTNKKLGKKYQPNYHRVRTNLSFPLSDTSLKLANEGACASNQTSLVSCEDNLQSRRESNKIKIISNIQVRPKRTLLNDKSEVQQKKRKTTESPVGDIGGELSIISEHISNNEICNWIKTGSPNYTTKFTERRVMLKYTYLMFKNLLDEPDETEAYQDVQTVCKILKKYA